MRYIDGQDGLFLTVLPRTRKEDSLFREWMQTHEPEWIEVHRDKPELVGGDENVWCMIESPIPASDGFRLVWLKSSRMAAVDSDARGDIIGRVILQLEKLEKRLRNPRTRYRNKEAIAAAAERIIGYIAKRWIGYEVIEEETVVFRQEKRGRPGKNTQFRRETKVRYHVTWKTKDDAIAYDARTDGMFPLLTNAKLLSLEQLREAYKYQPQLEKRHEQLKTVYGVTPMFLKKITRIEALLCVYFLALLIESLIERECRRIMKSRGLKTIRLYPEDRPCKAPTTDKILQVFDMVQLHRLYKDGKVIQAFSPNLTFKQRELLGWLSVPEELYTDLA
jgi:hypothetical protein